jgi:hypothetical protein
LQRLTLNQIVQDLAEYHRQTGNGVDLLFIGGLALQAYGFTECVTVGVDGELVGELDPLMTFLQQRQILADLGENISGWSIVAMPPGYRERESVWHEEAGLRLRLLEPVDFIIAKLRRGTDQDLNDASYVATQYRILPGAVQASAESAIRASPQDTALYLFKKTVQNFCQQLAPL